MAIYFKLTGQEVEILKLHPTKNDVLIVRTEQGYNTLAMIDDLRADNGTQEIAEAIENLTSKVPRAVEEKAGE